MRSLVPDNRQTVIQMSVHPLHARTMHSPPGCLMWGLARATQWTICPMGLFVQYCVHCLVILPLQRWVPTLSMCKWRMAYQVIGDKDDEGQDCGCCKCSS